MTVAPILFQNLLDLHGVDVVALEGELSASDRVRTRTWPAGANDRTPLETLPADFPGFKGVVVAGELRIEAMWLAADISFKALATVTRLTMPMPRLPETLLAGLTGQPLARFAAHRSFDADTVILARREQIGRSGGRELVLDLRMARQGLEQRMQVRVVRRPDPVDIAQLLGATHQRLAGAARMPMEMARDPRRWESALDGRYTVAGLEIDEEDGSVMVRFPYDPVRVARIGRAGFGAWFDRRTFAWRLTPTATALAGLSAFLGQNADIVVDPRGDLHIKRQD